MSDVYGKRVFEVTSDGYGGVRISLNNDNDFGVLMDLGILIVGVLILYIVIDLHLRCFRSDYVMDFEIL